MILESLIKDFFPPIPKIKYLLLKLESFRYATSLLWDINVSHEFLLLLNYVQ